MDLFDLLIAAIWIFFIFRNFSKGKQQGKKLPKPLPREDSEYQEPSNQQDSPYTIIDDEEDPDEDERKLKEWLEKVFGKAEPEPQYEEQQEIYTETRDYYEREQPLFMTEEPKEYDEYGYDYNQDTEFANSKGDVAATLTRSSNPWNGKLGKAQVAHGLVMAEILQKPRSLRPVEYIGAKSGRRQLKKG